MGIFNQIKDVMAMRNEQKRIEKEMAKITAEYTNGGITVAARGDMTITSITALPEAYDEVKQGKSARFETMLTNCVNGALKRVREASQQQMMKLLEEKGLGNLFGK